MPDFTIIPSWVAKIPISRTIVLIKIGLMASGVYKFIESFYFLFGETSDIEFITFISYSIIATVIVFVMAIIITLICTYLYKHVKKILEC